MKHIVPCGATCKLLHCGEGRVVVVLVVGWVGGKPRCLWATIVDRIAVLVYGFVATNIAMLVLWDQYHGSFV